MRRSDREITDPEQIRSFIAQEKILRVGFCDGGEVYIVPVNYGCSVSEGRYIFYFHGAKAGRKYELSRTSPKVGFEIDGRYQLSEADTACGHSAEFQSVIGTGIISLTVDNDEKRAALDLIMKQATGRADWEYTEEMLDKTAVYRLEAGTITCKAK